MNRIKFLYCMCCILSGSILLGQDCSDPAPLCYEELNNIQMDSTTMGPLMANFSCGTATNGVLYEITTVGPGALDVVIENVDCDLTNPGLGDSLIVAVFTSTTPSNPCSPPPAMSEIACVNTDAGDSFSLNAIVAGETYYVAVFGEMDGGDLAPAECGYDIQIDGPAVEFSINFPTEPETVLEGNSVDVEGISGADDYEWSGPGLIDSISGANPTITPPFLGDDINNTFTYTLTSTLGECVIVNELTVIVNPNVIPTDVITPNGDGINDLWLIANLPISRIEEIEIKVFDRWGQQVFKSIGYREDQYWDGTNNGKKLPMGAYYYVIDLNLSDSDAELVTGAISLIY